MFSMPRCCIKDYEDRMPNSNIDDSRVCARLGYSLFGESGTVRK